MESEPDMPNQRSLLKPTLQITFLSILGVLVNFVTQIILAAKFGVTMERDAYFAAVVIPAYITTVLLGSLTVTFVPIFIEYEIKKSKVEAWKVVSIFTNLTFLVLFGITSVCFIFAKQLISVTAPGFKGEVLSLTAILLRIILPSIIFTGLTSLVSSIYYAEHRFLRPAIIPVISATLMLLSVILFARYWGIKSLAFGYLIGAVAGFFILVPTFFKQGHYLFSFDFRNEAVIQIIRVMSPLVFAALFYKATTVIERMIASTLPTGSISYLGYANRITHILGAVATLGISTTIFPVMARSWAENDLAKVREYFAKGVRIIMLITFPIAMVFVVLRTPIIQVVFERGAFTHDTTLAVANVLMIFMVYFVCTGLGNIIGKGFYISQRTKLLAILGITQSILYFGYAYILAKRFSYIGLAVATSMYFFFSIIINTFIMRGIYNGINGRRIVDGFVKIGLASLCCGICCYLLNNSRITGSSLIVKTGMAGLGGSLVYLFITVYILRIDEATILKDKVYRTLKEFTRQYYNSSTR